VGSRVHELYPYSTDSGRGPSGLSNIYKHFVSDLIIEEDMTVLISPTPNLGD